MTLQVLKLTAIFLHANLENIEQTLLKICNFRVSLVVLKKIKASSQEALDEFLLNLLFWPKHVNILLEDILQEELEDILTRHGDCAHFLLSLLLFFSSIFFRNSPLSP